MTKFEEFFDGKIFVINLERRKDRRSHFEYEMNQIRVTTCERFNAIDAGPLGNHGCTQSHRAVLELIIKRKLKRAFIFEDDATVRDQFRISFDEEFAAAAAEVPPDWDMFYLGGHYAEVPRKRVGKHLVLMNAMKTTSSYGVTLKAAKHLFSIIPPDGGDSIDNIYAGFNASGQCYISEPRFFVQYNNYSDLQKQMCGNQGCMEDGTHVAAIGQPRPKDHPPLAAPKPKEVEPTAAKVVQRAQPTQPNWVMEQQKQISAPTPAPVGYKRTWLGRNK